MICYVLPIAVSTEPGMFSLDRFSLFPLLSSHDGKSREDQVVLRYKLAYN